MLNFILRKQMNFYLTRNQKEFLYRQYNKIKSFKKNSVKYPKHLSISLTTYCNLRCRFCDREEFNASYMSLENLKKLNKPIRHAKQIDLTGWGEAILYKHYKQCVKYIFDINKNKQIIAQTSNGSLSNRYADILKGRIKRFVISLNSSTKQTYEREMVGGKFNKTLNNISYFINNIDETDRKNVKLHFVTYTENYKEMPGFIKLASELGIPTVSFGQMMSNNPEENKFTLLNIKSEYNDVLEDVEEVSKKYHIEVFYRRFGENLGLNQNNCTAPFDELFVRTNGEISPCCYFGDVSFGNVFDNNFDDIWFSNSGILGKLRENRNFAECQVCAPFHEFDNEFIHKTTRHNQWDLGEAVNYKNKGIIEETVA